MRLDGHAPGPTPPRTPLPRVGFAIERRRARPPPNQTCAPTALRDSLRRTSHSHHISDVPPPPKPRTPAAPHENVDRSSQAAPQKLSPSTAKSPGTMATTTHRRLIILCAQQGRRGARRGRPGRHLHSATSPTRPWHRHATLAPPPRRHEPPRTSAAKRRGSGARRAGRKCGGCARQGTAVHDVPQRSRGRDALLRSASLFGLLAPQPRGLKPDLRPNAIARRQLLTTRENGCLEHDYASSRARATLLAR